jgi:hypothetical protein
MSRRSFIVEAGGEHAPAGLGTALSACRLVHQPPFAAVRGASDSPGSRLPRDATPHDRNSAAKPLATGVLARLASCDSAERMVTLDQVRRTHTRRAAGGASAAHTRSC